MEENRQSIPRQIAVGAVLGVLLGFFQRVKDPNPAPLFSSDGIAYMLGSVIGGVFLYMVLYLLFRFWPKIK